MKKKTNKPTLRTVAEACGVRPATVSRVLNKVDNNFSVKPETRDLILKTALDMAYIPNTAARSLRRRRFDLVLIFGYDLPNFLPAATYGDMLGALVQRLNADGYQVNMTFPPPAGRKTAPLSCDGAVFIDTGDSELIDDFRRHAMPMLILNDRIEDCSWVAVDDTDGMRRLLAQLAAAGHRRIAYRCANKIHRLQSHQSISDRYQTYQEWARTHEMKMVTDYDQSMSNHEFIDAVQETGCTAVATYDEKLAMSFYQSCLERNLGIPEDLSLVAFDKPVNYDLMPKITAMWQPAEQMGEAAAEILLRQIKGRSSGPEQMVMKLNLHEGASIAPPPLPDGARLMEMA